MYTFQLSLTPSSPSFTSLSRVHLPSPSSSPNCSLFSSLLFTTYQNLAAFYPQGSLEQLAQNVHRSGALPRIAAEWRIPMEVAMDLCRLALFDVILYLDDSGSMSFEENGSRIGESAISATEMGDEKASG